MKKIRLAVCVMMLAVAMLCMTGCGNRDNTMEGTTAQMTTSADRESMGTTGGMDETGGAMGNTMENTSESGMTGTNEGTSAGVIEGLVDDVERGVDDMTGERETTRAAADESR